MPCRCAEEGDWGNNGFAPTFAEASVGRGLLVYWLLDPENEKTSKPANFLWFLGT